MNRLTSAATAVGIAALVIGFSTGAAMCESSVLEDWAHVPPGTIGGQAASVAEQLWYDHAQRTDAAAYAYCGYLGKQTNAYSDCYLAVSERLRYLAPAPAPPPSLQWLDLAPASAPPPSPAPPARAKECDPEAVKQRIRQQHPGIDPAVGWRVMMGVLEAYGCIGRRP